ncbi:hypothetical protein JOQ06_004694, partial [Pogonophryne albipinna]
ADSRTCAVDAIETHKFDGSIEIFGKEASWCERSLIPPLQPRSHAASSSHLTGVKALIMSDSQERLPIKELQEWGLLGNAALKCPA